MARGRARPPNSPKERRKWDETRNWKRTFRRRTTNDEIIPDFIQHWRPMILEAYRDGGIHTAEEKHGEFRDYFRQLAKEGHMTRQEAEGAIENLDSLLSVMKKKQRR